MVTPLIELDKYKDEILPSDKDMYNDLITNYDGIKYFLNNVKFIQNSQDILKVNPMTNSEDKIKEVQKSELKAIDLENKVSKMTDNIDNLLQNYNETVDIINQKFALYNQILDQRK